MTNDLFQVLRQQSIKRTQQDALIHVEAGRRRTYSYEDLFRRASNVAAQLRERCQPGDRVLLVFPQGPEFVFALFGCFAAGVIAVPVPPPNPLRMARSMPRLLSIMKSAGPSVALTAAAFRPSIHATQHDFPLLHSIPWMSFDQEEQASSSDEEWMSGPLRASEDVAILQYTSGSTADPKGVILTHRSLLDNASYFDDEWNHDADSVIVTWLPTFHDLGLVYGILTPLVLGVPTVLMSPAEVIQYPSRWLRAITEFRGTHSGGPNFIYDLCVRRIPPAEREHLDLSSWRMALTAAEPIRAETLYRFYEAFQNHGFRWRTFCPGYGLSEATCKVAAESVERDPVLIQVDAEALEHHEVRLAPPEAPSSRTLIGCGKPGKSTRVRIVDPESLFPCPVEKVGEIWVQSNGLGLGYWNQVEATQRDFQAFLHGSGEGPFLRTGDLGFLWQGNLFVTGRIKDLIIVRGVNYYPQDIEHTVTSAHSALRPGCCAAFPLEVGGTETVAVVVEAERRYRERRQSSSAPFSDRRSGHDRRVMPVEPPWDPVDVPLDPVEVRACIREAVSKDHGLAVAAIALIVTGSIPKTSSGKIQRGACKALFLSGRLETVCDTTTGGSH